MKHKDLIILHGQYHVCWWPVDPRSHAMWKPEYSRTPRLILLLMLWIFGSPGHQHLLKQYWYLLATFSEATETRMIKSYFHKKSISYFKFVFIKNISFGDTYWVQGIFSQYWRCWCAGALSSMPNTDQDQIAPLWVSILIFHWSGANIVNLLN